MEIPYHFFVVTPKFWDWGKVLQFWPNAIYSLKREAKRERERQR